MDNDEYLYSLKEYLKKIKNIKKIDFLPYHTLGENKYEKMEMEYPLKGVPQLSKDEAVQAETLILKAWGKDVKPINTIEEDIKSGGTACFLRISDLLMRISNTAKICM